MPGLNDLLYRTTKNANCHDVLHEEFRLKTNLPVTLREQPFPEGKYVVSRTDLKGLITAANSTFVELSGFSMSELIGQNHNLVRHPDMPPQAFSDLWDTVKAGRPWRGVVKNRCKNGDFYWVDALVVPVIRDQQVVGYMSVRSKPSREQIDQAETLYRQIMAGIATLPKPVVKQRLNLQSKLFAVIGLMIFLQVMGIGAEHFGSLLGVGQEVIGNCVAVLGIGAGAGLMLMLSSLFKAQQGIVERITHMTEGDLTDEIPICRDGELGKLNNALIGMQTHLKVMIAEIAEASGVVGENSHQLMQQIAETHQVSAAQSDAVAKIATAMDDLSGSIEKVSHGAANAANAVGRSLNLIAEASEHMEASQRASSHVVSTVTQAGSTMAALFKSIHAVGSVTRTIQEIADQTNLLALNAAIEAARAGDSGRGFAVVADEVRSLADRSRTKTHEITETVAEILRVTQLAVVEMENAGGLVSQTDSAMNGARTGLQVVSENSCDVSRLSSDIAMATHEQSLAVSGVVQQTESIVSGVDQTVNAIIDMRTEAVEMERAANTLSQLIGSFRFVRA